MSSQPFDPIITVDLRAILIGILDAQTEARTISELFDLAPEVLRVTGVGRQLQTLEQEGAVLSIWGPSRRAPQQINERYYARTSDRLVRDGDDLRIRDADPCFCGVRFCKAHVTPGLARQLAEYLPRAKYIRLDTDLATRLARTVVFLTEKNR